MKFFAALMLWTSFTWSMEINESDLFGDPSSLIVDSTTKVVTYEDTTPSGLKASGSVTGQISSISIRDSLHPVLSSQAIANLYLDARSSDGTKAFAAIEGSYLADSSKQQAHLRELFLDFDLKQTVYIRTGKQVLQWGRCYFWNPSDLINIERKAFVERAGSREGVYGIRSHIPFGTRANLYGFWDVDEATKLDETRGSLKAEILLGSTETAVSIWKRNHLNPVFAWDISSRIGRWDIAGEAAFFPEGFVDRYQIRNDTLYAIPNHAFTPRAALSFGRSFDILEIQERLRVQYELYYNGLGYSENPAKDTLTWYPWKNAVQKDSLYFRNGPKALWLYMNDQITPYNIGRFYAAFFTSYGHVFHPDLSFTCNGIMNLVDRSWMLASGLSFSTLHNLQLQGLLVRMGGDYPSEMTYSGQEWMVQITMEYSF